MRRYRTYILLMIVMSGMHLSGCATSPPQRLDLPQKELPYVFNKNPFVHPKIIEDLMGYMSDKGDQVVAINLLDAQESNRYYGDIKVRELSGQQPYVYVQSDDGEEFGYQYIGRTQSGVHVLMTSYSGVGSGIFRNLVLLTLENDHALVADWDKLIARPEKKRLLIRKQGEIPLGDRWGGELKVRGNEVFIGKDTGWFSVSGGTGGGPFSYDRKDRIMKIEIEGEQAPERDRVPAAR